MLSESEETSEWDIIKIPDVNKELDDVNVEDIELKYDNLYMDRIAGGGFADVYHIFYKEQEAVLKQPRSLELNDAMLHEAKIMNKFRHEHICKVIGVCTKDPFKGLVLEYCAGETLDQLLKKVREANITVETLTVLCWCEQIANGMQHLSKTHVHGDLKPENVLVKERVCCCQKPKFKQEQFRDKTFEICTTCRAVNLDKITLKICDFGNSFEKGKLMSKRCGTIQYMASEVNKGEGHTEKSDVYSFGVVMFSLVLGAPFADLDATEVAILKLRKEAALDTSCCASNSISEIISHCTAHVPANRPTFHEVVEKLNSRIPKYMSLSSDRERREANLERKKFLKHYENLNTTPKMKRKGKKDKISSIKQRRSTEETLVSFYDNECSIESIDEIDDDDYMKPSSIRFSEDSSTEQRSSPHTDTPLPISTKKPQEKNLLSRSLNVVKVKMLKMIS